VGYSRLQSLLATARELAARVTKSRVIGIAAEMSFWLFLALVPLATVGGLVVAKLSVGNTGAVQDLFGPLPQVARDLLVHELATVSAWKGETVAPTAIAAFLWAASSGVHAIFDAMEMETGCARPWWTKRLIAVLACIVLPVGVAVLAILGTGLSWTWRLAGTVAPVVATAIGASPLALLVRLGLGALVAVGLVSALFYAGVPEAARREMPVLPGAILAVVLEAVLGYGYAFYLATMGIGGAYGAGLAVVGVTLTAVYLFSVALLIGLGFNVMGRDRRRAKGGRRSGQMA
jgi:membrane protein